MIPIESRKISSRPSWGGPYSMRSRAGFRVMWEHLWERVGASRQLPGFVDQTGSKFPTMLRGLREALAGGGGFEPRRTESESEAV
jgi:hypothetical protein